MQRTLMSAVSAAALSLALVTAAPGFAAGLDAQAAHGLSMLGVPVPPEDSVTTEQVTQIVNVLGSSDADSTKRAAINQILGIDTNDGNTRPGVRQLRDSVASDLSALGIDTAGLDMLTLSQLGQIENVTSGSGDVSFKKAKISEIMGTSEATATGRLGVGQLKSSTAADLASLGIDTEQLDSVTLSQLGQIENVMGGSESDAQKRNQIETILGR